MDKIYIGSRVADLYPGLETLPITKVELMDENGDIKGEAGDDTGRTLTATNPDGTDTMAADILAAVGGFVYRPYEGVDSLIDPSAELGDGVTVGGLYSVLAQESITFDELYSSDISAPTTDEIEDEYPYISPIERQIKRNYNRTYSLITKTAEEIRLEVANEVDGLSSSFQIELDNISAEIESVDGRVTSLDMGLDGIQTQVTGLDGSVSALEQYVDSFTLSVSNGSTSSTITLKAGSATIASQTINMSGLVTYTGLSSGTTTIDGACIKTGTIDADRLNLTGAITFSDLTSSLQDDFDYAYETADEAWDMAYDAQSLAGEVGDVVDGWTYGSSTYIDGSMIMTGTVMASYLLGGYVGLLTSSEREVGGISIAYTSTGYGLEIYTDYGGIRIESGGNVFISSTYNTRLQLDDEGAKIGPDLYLTNGTQITSDRNLKHDIEYDISAYDALFDSLKPCRFKYNDGTSDRYHTALIAQDVKDAVLSAGLTTQDFAAYCDRPVYALDEEGNRTAEITGQTCSLRYDEFISLCIWQIQKLKARVAELEDKL